MPEEAQNILNNANHTAYRCRDAEQTRWFYEDVLGLPLRIAFSEENVPGTNEPTPFMHLFFQLGNGDFIAFFDEPTNATPAHFATAHSFDRHIAFEVDSEEEMLAWQKKINEKGVMCLGPVDHGFLKSVYMYDPNGMQVEITSKTPIYTEYAMEQGPKARKNLDEWVQRTREQKVGKFGAEALDKRKIPYPGI
ncbi:glyoxalase/bleomycin resistance protein/dioxygenase superfamily protein 9 [Hyphomonas adhaerens MHS-3]|uniref:Glyoxalase/bleomycin resistance protein/dioxygenase superfamily protein 9 n=1 Tax=Hyphomonas adhaerens MHS-3 TaxID=1280949 RepID=A0A069E7Y1_9PROT|nr:VOC family protein [Hyphomonas adhaerens]KCZ86162.1 glyoxalase/bleomycin resistance protein/dioxygenase superfamily protein 9 [Hyphomonas adhaerens MHS-3]